MAADVADDFQKELVDLFIEEAHEWLQNIHVACDELEQGPIPERRGELIEMLLAGVTNLGGSAATINLRGVTDASFAAVPLIEALRDPLKAASVQDFFALCWQLGHIQAALTCAGSLSSGEGGTRAGKEGIPADLSPAEFVLALRELQEKQTSSIASERNHIRNLIEQLEQQVQAGVQMIDVTLIRDYLARAAESEELFLKTIDEQLPEISRKMSALKMDEEEAFLLKAVGDTPLQDVARLLEEAQKVNAGSAELFFTGLHSLLTLVAQRRVPLASARIESVKARLHAIGEAIRQWVEHGRAQRAAIDQLISVSHS